MASHDRRSGRKTIHKYDLVFPMETFGRGEKIPLDTPEPTVTVFSDASESGSGAILYAEGLSKIRTAAPLPSSLRGQSSTAREMFAILASARALGRFLSFQHCVWYSDSQCAVRILSKGSLKKDLQSLALQIWDLCEALHATIDFVWIPRSLNTEADLASRFIDLDDLVHCRPRGGRAQEFLGRVPDSPARQLVGIDAFSAESSRFWKSDFCWWVPPPYLIPKTLSWARLHRSKGILGFPMWPSNMFFPLLRQGDSWIQQIRQIIIFPAGTPVLQGPSPSFTFTSPKLKFDFAFALLSFWPPPGFKLSVVRVASTLGVSLWSGIGDGMSRSRERSDGGG
ncbi:ribonuclease HI [Cooperia oncophora]